jgi:hypothetical protein
MQENEKLSNAQEIALILKKVTTNPALPEVSNGVYSFKAEFVAQEASVDGAALYIYHAGYKVTIPNGYIGIYTPADTVASASLSPTSSIRILTPGKEHDLFLAFRLTTNAAPAMFKTHEYGQEATLTSEAKKEEQGSIYANLTIVKNEDSGEYRITQDENYDGDVQSDKVEEVKVEPTDIIFDSINKQEAIDAEEISVCPEPSSPVEVLTEA